MNYTWFNYLCIIGVTIGLLSSSIVATVLFKMKYKDNSTLLRIYLHIIDIGLEIIILIPFLVHIEDPIYLCYYDAFYYFIIIFRSIWIWFIAYSLYMIICKNDKTMKKGSFLFFVLFFLISFLVSIPILIVKINDENFNICLNSKYRLIYVCINGIGFGIILFIFVFYFHYKIRRNIKRWNWKMRFTK